MVGLIALYAFHSWVSGWIVRDQSGLRRFRSKLLSAYCKLGLKLLGVNVNFVSGESGVDLNKQNFLVVCNHLSYVDVLVMSSLFRALFVTSVEVQKTPVLGQLSELAGSLFVERRNRDKTHLEVGGIAQALADGMNVVVFPEATSSSGESVLPFKASMFNAAVQSGVEVLPMCLGLAKVNNDALTPETRDSVCYYGDMGFFSHFIRLLKLKNVEMNLSVLKPIRGADLRQLRDESFSLITEAHSHFLSSSKSLIGSSQDVTCVSKV